jgi:hypothetical protein
MRPLFFVGRATVGAWRRRVHKLRIPVAVPRKRREQAVLRVEKGARAKSGAKWFSFCTASAVRPRRFVALGQ